LAFTCDPPPAGELDLHCTLANGTQDVSSVERATPVRCTASVTPPGGALVISDWAFAATGGGYSTHRAGVDPSFTPSSTTWEGPLVKSGTVTVSGTVAGQAVSPKSVTLTVRAREWRNRAIPGYPSVPQYRGQFDLPTIPTEVGDLGHTTTDYDATSTVVINSPGAMGVVASGPNVDLVYLQEIPKVVKALYIDINEAALKPNSVFWRGQIEHNSNRILDPRCDKGDVTSANTLRKIKEHEGTAFELDSHAEAHRKASLDLIGPAVEGVVALDADLDSVWEAVIRPVLAQVNSRMKAIDQTNGVRFGCEFNFSNRR
jgi:hypothetical protein